MGDGVDVRGNGGDAVSENDALQRDEEADVAAAIRNAATTEEAAALLGQFARGVAQGARPARGEGESPLARLKSLPDASRGTRIADALSGECPDLGGVFSLDGWVSLRRLQLIGRLAAAAEEAIALGDYAVAAELSYDAIRECEHEATRLVMREAFDASVTDF